MSFPQVPGKAEPRVLGHSKLYEDHYCTIVVQWKPPNGTEYPYILSSLEDIYLYHPIQGPTGTLVSYNALAQAPAPDHLPISHPTQAPP